MENTFSIAYVGVILCAVCGFYFFLVFCFYSLLHKNKKKMSLFFHFDHTSSQILHSTKLQRQFSVCNCILHICVLYTIYLFYDFSFSIYCSLRIASNVDSIVATYLCLTMCFELHSMLSINAYIQEKLLDKHSKWIVVGA